MGPPRKPLIFMNLSDPINDSKKPENRKVVAKWAMINRPKGSSNPSGTSQGPSANLHYKSRTLSDATFSNASFSTASSPEPPARVPLTPESLPSSHSPPPPQKPAGGPGYNTAGFRSTGDYYSLPIVEDTASWRAREKAEQAQARVVDSRQRHAAKAKANRDRVQEARSAQNQVFSNRAPQNSTAVTLRNGNVPANPSTLLSTTRDPFGCLPVKTNHPHTQELIYLYLNAHTLSPAFTQGSAEISQRIKSYRQSTWFPLVLENQATMNALVAYIESTPDLPIKSRDPDFLISHVQSAYEGMRYALSNPKTETDDAICVAVVLLMLTAQRLGDLTTFRAHANGLTHLLSARRKAFRTYPHLREREVEKWQDLNITIYGPPSRDPCKYCQDAHLRGSRSPSPECSASPGGPSPHSTLPDEASLAQSPTGDPKLVPSQPRGWGFYDLIAKGFLTSNMSNFVEQVLIWSTLAEQARHDRLSAAAAVSHAWIDDRPGRLQPLDTACQLSVRLCLYLSTWLEGGHSCTIVRRMISACYASLRSPGVDIPRLLAESPQALLWFTFVCGPFAEDYMARQWFMCLQVRARHKVSPEGMMDFDEAFDFVSNQFLLTRSMKPGAQKFWEENSWDVGTAAVWMESPF